MSQFLIREDLGITEVTGFASSTSPLTPQAPTVGQPFLDLPPNSKHYFHCP